MTRTGEQEGRRRTGGARADQDHVVHRDLHCRRAGQYTVAFTCDAFADMPDADDHTPPGEETDLVDFFGTADVVIEADSNTVHDFEAPMP